MAFGHFGRYYVALSGGLITRFSTDREAFRAIILHELAHLNGDVNKTYFTWAIWWAFVAAVLLPSLLKELLFLDDHFADLVYLGGTILVLTALIYLTRNAVLRAREFYADVRASAWDGRTRALGRVLETLPGVRGGRLWAMLSVHPSPQQRRQTLEDTGRLFRFGWWEAVGTGIAAILALFPLTLFSIFLATVALHKASADSWEPIAAVLALLLTIGPSLLVISVAVAAVGGGAWQATFVALVRGDSPREAMRLGCGLGIGLMLGVLISWALPFAALMASPFWRDLRPSILGWAALVGSNIIWSALLLMSLVLFFRWVMVGSSAWREATLHSRSPSRVYRIGLMLTSVLFSVWFGILFMGGLFSNGLLLWGSETRIVAIGTVFAIVLLIAMINPLTFLGLMSLWALPLAAWFWRQRGSSGHEPAWLFLDPSPQPWIAPRQAPLRPGLALTLGVGGGLIYCGLLPLIRAELVPSAVMLGQMLHEEAVRQFGSDTFVPHLIKDVVVSGVLAAPAAVLQACAAALVAAWVERLGALHGLFAAFVAGGVMTIGIRWLWGDVSSELEFWLLWLPLVGNGGALMALFTGLVASVVGKRLRNMVKGSPYIERVA